MKRLVALLVTLVVCTSLFGEEKPGLRLGLQFSSDSFFGLLVTTRLAEVGVKAQADLSDGIDPADDVLVVGAHAGYLLRPSGQRYSVSLGGEIQAGLGTGDVDYKEYLNLGPRLGFNYQLGDHFLASGLVYPLWLSTREYGDVEDSWYLTATIPRAAVALAFLF